MGKNNLRLKVIDKSDKDYKNCFIELVVNIGFLKNMIKDLKNFTVSDFNHDIELSEREMEVLKLLSEGKNNSKIAEELHISFHTVKVHIHNIFNKLCAKDRTEAVIKAIKANILKI